MGRDRRRYALFLQGTYGLLHDRRGLDAYQTLPYASRLIHVTRAHFVDAIQNFLGSGASYVEDIVLLLEQCRKVSIFAGPPEYDCRDTASVSEHHRVIARRDDIFEPREDVDQLGLENSPEIT